MRLCLTLAASLLAVSNFAVAAEVNPVRRQPQVAAEPSVHRVIVKLRTAESAQRVQAQAARNRVSALASRAGFALRMTREIAPDLQALQLEPVLAGESVDDTLARLRADADVEFADPDQRRYPHAVPNDPIYTNQWYLQATQASAIRANTAWDTTTGAASLVIAFADTGVRFEHPDLLRQAQNGRLLDGYDFVSADSANVFRTANDGNGRDADASDPGDWIDSNDQALPEFADCETGSSSWHGTRVAGILGARTNNAAGIAGTTWEPLLLPVRVLGKCGGFDSDVIAGMRWAAGLAVSGVPANLNPAKIINLSLGAAGPCSSSYQSAVNEVRALGVLIVVSAGNEDGHAVDSPANCSGVLGVAGLRHVGTKVGFSNVGPQVGISAPGGNCVNTSGACLFSLDTTTDSGATTPAGSIYTDQFNTNLGTSFSAPIVAGAAALVRSVNSNLTPAQVITRLQQTATPFPVASGVPMCVAPTGVDQIECNCTTTTCGAGMLNADAAVAAALRPFVIASATPTNPTEGQTVTLTGNQSFAADNRSIVSYAWTVVSSGGTSPTLTNAGAATASFTAPAAGAITLRLTVTDTAGDADSADVVVTTPNAAPPPPPTPSSGGGGGGGTFDWLCLAALSYLLLRRLKTVPMP